MATQEEKQKALAAALGQIEKQFGKGSIMKLGDTQALDVESVSTGSLGLDVALALVVYQWGVLLKFLDLNLLVKQL